MDHVLLLVIVGLLVLLLGAVMASSVIGVVGVLVLVAAGERAWSRRRESR
jgi:membrane-bound ClpP family serine protease